jgi:hypothetical protein
VKCECCGSRIKVAYSIKAYRIAGIEYDKVERKGHWFLCFTCYRVLMKTLARQQRRAAA